MIKKRLVLLALLVSFCLGQGQVYRFMTYNLLNYENPVSRNAYFQTVIKETAPDVLVCEEVKGSTGYNNFLNNVLNVVSPGAWKGAQFIDQTTNVDIALYYKPTHFKFVSTRTISAPQSYGLRSVVEFILEQVSTGVRVRVYGVHLKAGRDTDNASTRKTEATILRNYLNDLAPGTHFIVCGDFNIYSNANNTEPAFNILTQPGDDSDGQLFDPVNRIGEWHNNGAFAEVHTQSTRTTDPGDGGSTGGLDDRFDWIFVSGAVMEETYDMTYVADSYWAFGNDGNHFNRAVNYGTNTSVSTAVANALAMASDHLPVIADFRFPAGEPSPYKIVISEIMPNPAQVSDTYGEWLEIYNNDTITIDLTGWVLKDIGNDYHQIEVENGKVIIDPGEYLVMGRSADTLLNGGYYADYEYSNVFFSNAEDQVILLDADQQIVDEVDYTNAFPYGSGVSMYLTDMNLDNNLAGSWKASTTPYGKGDKGTPGRAWDDTLGIEIGGSKLPVGFSLYQNYPNPFNPVTTIRYGIPERTRVEIIIFDLLGRQIRSFIDPNENPGFHFVSWDGKDDRGQTVGAGVYLYRIRTDRYTAVRKMVLLK